MPQKTLTTTRTKTITMTRMLTASLALALANAVALAAVPFGERPFMDEALPLECRVESLSFGKSCSKDGFSEGVVTCGGGQGEMLLRVDQCVPMAELSKQAALVCREECLSLPLGE